MRHAARWILLVLVAASGLPVTAQVPTRDPGAIVLLAESEGHTADSELQRALLDPDPRVRLVAARVIGAGAHAEMLGYIIGALMREQNPDVGTELVRAALYLGGHRDLAIIEAQAKRLGRGAQLAKADWHARVQPSLLLAALPDLVRDLEHGVSDLISLAAAEHPAMASALFDEWMRLAPEHGWADLIERAYGTADLRDGAAVLKKALASARPFVREETVWFVVIALRDERKVPNDVLDAALPIEGVQASEWETFGRELIARHRSKARTPDRASLIARQSESKDRVMRALNDLAVLSRPEREALAALGGRPVSPLAYWRARHSSMRTIDPPAAGVVGATLDAAGCKASGELGGATVEYWADGRPRTIKVHAGGLSPACVKALSALTRLSIAETGASAAGVSQLVVLPFHAAFFACSSRSDREPPRTVGSASGKITTPRKTRDVRPDYPDEAERQRIQGVVVLEGTISRHGCIQTARVMRSIPRLDIPAMWAVTQWLFEPTLLDGAPVPVTMTVTVNFQLR